MRIWRSGRENVTNCEESGDSVIHVGVDFDYRYGWSVLTCVIPHETQRTFLNSYRSVSLL